MASNLPGLYGLWVLALDATAVVGDTKESPRVAGLRYHAKISFPLRFQGCSG